MMKLGTKALQNKSEFAKCQFSMWHTATISVIFGL